MGDTFYRVGRKVPTNIYKVTDTDPEGVYIGHACQSGEAVKIAVALNHYETCRHSHDGLEDEAFSDETWRRA